MQASDTDPEIQFGPIPEGIENDVDVVEDCSAELLIAGGDASASVPPSLQQEREEIKKMKEENEELREQLEAMKIRELSLTPIQSTPVTNTPTGRIGYPQAGKPSFYTV